GPLGRGRIVRSSRGPRERLPPRRRTARALRILPVLRGEASRSATTSFHSGIGAGSPGSVPLGGHRMSTILRTLRRVGVAAAVLVGAASLPGCGYGYNHHDDFPGTLEIVNDPTSANDIESFDIHLVGGWTDHYDLLLAPTDSFSIDLWPDDYTVTLNWSD